MSRAGLQTGGLARGLGWWSVSTWAVGVAFACALLEVPAAPPAGRSPEVAPAGPPRKLDPPRKDDKAIEFAPWEEVPA